MSRKIVLAVLGVLAATGAVNAQVLTPPPRVAQTQRTDPTPTTHTLLLNGSLLGGYDDNVSPADQLQAPDVVFRQSSYTGSGSANLRYSLANGSRALDVSGGGTANAYTNVGGDSGPLYGTDASVSFRTPIGARNSLSLSQSVNRSPYISMGLFNSVVPTGPVAYDPNGNPLNGLIDGNILSLASVVSVARTWARRTNSTLSYNFQNSMYRGGSVEFSDKSHAASLAVSQQFWRSTAVQGSYNVVLRGARQIGVSYDGLTHGLALGFTTTRPITRTRTLLIAAGGGADLVDVTGGSRFWQPSYYGRLGIDLGRSWNVSASYSQATSLLHTPLSAPDSYLTQTGVLSVGGNLGSRMDVVVNGGFTRGEVDAINSAVGAAGDYTAYTAATQLRARLTNWWSALVGVNYYESELSGAAQQFLQSSGHYERTSVRAGLSWTVPLYASVRIRRPQRGE